MPKVKLLPTKFKIQDFHVGILYKPRNWKYASLLEKKKTGICIVWLSHSWRLLYLAILHNMRFKLSTINSANKKILTKFE